MNKTGLVTATHLWSYEISMGYLAMLLQRFKIIYFLMGPWDPQTMILMGPRALWIGPIIDVFINWKFLDVSLGHR